MNVKGTALALRTVSATPATSKPWTMALEPGSFHEAFEMCKLLVRSGMLPKSISTPEAALAILMKGRDLGLSAMQAFATINIINGKPEASAQLMAAKVLSSGLAKFLRQDISNDQISTWTTQRVGDDKPVTMSFTAREAKAMGLDSKDNYKKQVETMLQWRCVSKICRAVYPDVVLGCSYTYGEVSGDLPPDDAEPVVVEPVVELDPVEVAAEESAEEPGIDWAALTDDQMAEMFGAATTAEQFETIRAGIKRHHPPAHYGMGTNTAVAYGAAIKRLRIKPAEVTK